MPPKKARSEKNQPKISSFMMSEKENPWSEDETDTGTTTEANEPIEVDDDISHEASRLWHDGHGTAQSDLCSQPKCCNSLYCFFLAKEKVIP
jgi:hypothetical protein